MNLAFCLYKYFPFGGLQRDFVRIALACQQRGHAIRVYVYAWEGPVPDGFEVCMLTIEARTNHRRNERFHAAVADHLESHPADAVIGFNKMPGLDVYYAADPCFEARAREQRSGMYRHSNRYKQFFAFEQAVFGAGSHAEILMISEAQIAAFRKYHGTPEQRFHLLPPGISRDCMAPENAEDIRREVRAEFGFAEDERMVLMVGSGFRTKGLDRALEAVAALAPPVRQKTRFLVVGQDNPSRFRRQIRRLHLEDGVRFMGGRDDVPRLMQGADVLIHPAYNENTGTVLLEAMVGGLPVLVTDVCGYAHYIADAGAGLVVGSPFEQEDLNAKLSRMLTSDEYPSWRKNGIQYGREKDLYSMPEKAADVIESVLHR